MTTKSTGRNLIMYLAMFALMAVAVEVVSTVFVYQKYNEYIAPALDYKGRSATLYLAKKVVESVKGKPWPRNTSSKPEPFRIPDSLHGYRIGNGHFEVTYSEKRIDSTETFKYFVTIKDDGSRFVGTAPYPTERDVYVFGDSFVFGEGVNDEQTFTYLLQSRFPNSRFHLFANPGHSLSNAYLNMRNLASKIGPEDLLILGYAQFYDVRHVAAPERMIWWGDAHAHKSQDPKSFKHVRVRLDGDSLAFDKIPLFCNLMGDYCKQPNPRQGYMDTVTARIINGIASMTKAKVRLLHFQGPLRTEMTSQLDPRIEFIHASPESFDYKYRDDINGFNPHPGPYWNHAMFRRVSDTLNAIGFK
jgi:hypothetical protein